MFSSFHHRTQFKKDLFLCFSAKSAVLNITLFLKFWKSLGTFIMLAISNFS